MKCKYDNACSHNPKRHREGQEIARNYGRQPVREWEHLPCPFRINGQCENKSVQIMRFKECRKIIKDYKIFLEKSSKGIKFYREETLCENLEKYCGAKIEYLKNPKDQQQNGWFIFGLNLKKKNPTTDDLREYVKGFVKYHLDHINKSFIYYTGLLECFDIIRITKLPLRIVLWGEIDNFNDPDIYNWEYQDSNLDTWFYKETEVNGVKVGIHIKEKKPLLKEGELNTER